MQHVAQTSESDIKLESDINNGPKVGNLSTPSSPRSPPCSPPCTPPDTPPDRLSDSFQYLSDSSGSGDEDISEVDSFIIDTDELTEEAKTRISSKLLLPSSEEGGERTVDPETQARLQSLLKAAGINKLTAGDGKQLADPEVLRRLTSSVSCALDEAAAALTRMRSDSRQANKRALIKACTQGNVTAVRKLLKQGISVNETSEEGESLLSLACSAGYYELAQVLLAMHASVEDRGSKGDCTPLMEAASAGFVDIVRLLLAHGADVNAQSATGNTPLMYACAGGHVQTVRVLLDADANVEDHNENGHTPLMEAASAGHVEVAKMLLEQGAGINTHSNEFKESALTLACYKGHLEMVNFLLQAGADQEHKTDEMHTALMEASMDGHVEVAKLLLDSGAQVNMPTDSFESPLTLAACGGHVDLAILLIERGANIEEVNDEGYTPLMEAAREGHEDMVAVLLQRGARINAQTEETQETALTLACCGGFIEVADYLIKHGADLELGASTPLMEAAQEGHLELVRYLLEAGANVHAHTQTNDTALTYACENGHTDVADLLLQYGAHLEHESEGGRTPLMKACRAGHLCTVQFLVSKNADINRRTTNNDHTPLSLACAGGHFAIVQFLLDHGADMFHKLKDNSTMLIEAAKGGHTNVVQLLLDYPELCGSNVDSGNVSMATSSAAATAATGGGAVSTTATTVASTMSITATATQTCTIPTSSAPDTTKPNNTARNSVVVSGSNNSVASVSSGSSSQSKVTNDAVRQISSSVPKTAVRKQSRDPRLVDPRTAEKFQKIAEAKKNISLQDSKKEENVAAKGNSVKQIPQQQQQLKQQTLQLQQKQQQQLQQKAFQQASQKSHSAQQVSKSQQDLQQLDQQFQDKMTISSTIEQQVMQSQIIVEELKRVEQEMKESGMSNPLNSGSGSGTFSKESSNCRGILCSVDPMFSSSSENTTTSNQVIPLSTVVTVPANNTPTNVDSANLPPPPPLIPISEVLQSTAISDRPKAKPTKKEGKILRKHHLHTQLQQHLLQLQQQQQQMQQQQQQLQKSQQLQAASPASNSRQTNNHEEQQQVMQSTVCQAAIQQQQSQALHLKYLAQINAQLQQQVIKNQQQIEMHQQQQQQQQQLLQQQQATCTPQQTPSQPSQQPQLIGSGTITVATNAPNLADIFNHQELLAQIQQMDSSFAKTFPDFAEKTIEKEMRAMQQMMSCDMIQESLQRCHFLASISEDEVLDISKIKTAEAELLENMEAFSLEDVTNSAITIEEKKLCDIHQHPSATLIEATMKNSDKLPSEKLNLSTATSNNQTSSSSSNQTGVTSTDVEQQQNSIQLFPKPQTSLQPSSLQLQSPLPLQKQNSSPLLHTPSPQTQQPQSTVQQSTAKQKPPPQKQTLTSAQQQIQLKQQLQQQREATQSQQPPPPPPQQKQKPLQFQQKQILQQKGQIQQHHFQQIQRFQSPKPQQQNGSNSDSLSLNSQARQELHRHLNEMKAIAQSTAVAVQQNHTTVTKCVADSTVSHAATSTQTTVATIKKKIPFDDAAGALTKLAIGKKMRTVNPRVPPSTGVHVKDDSSSPRVPSTNVAYNQNYSMDVDSETESNHDTALTLACAGGHEELVELLLSRGADIEHRDKKGFTPLILAATAGHEKVVDLLLNHNADIEAQSERTKDTPLSLACSGGRYEVVDLLLGRGANKEHRNVSDYTPLSLAASGGYVNIIKLLLSHGAEINSRTGSKLGISPLMLAAMNGHTAAVKLLLDMGSDINAQIETNRNTALTLACFQGRHEVVSLLLERKANVEHRAKTGLTPLMEAASGGYVEVGRVLLEKGADVNAPPVPSSRDTALTIASDKGHVRFVELLINKGAQVEVKNKKGNSPMWLAANGGHLQVVELLYKVGADIDSQDNRKVSCLMAAFRKGHVKPVTWMVDRVNQFPSDQEMTRYISTISDKDLLDKCQACMKIIRVAKDEQAEKANEFATILLEELDLEKTREEFKKMAAARRKERKKNKKLQKIFEKRKQQENENNDEYSENNSKNDDEEEEDEEAEEEYQPSNLKDKKDSKGVSKRPVVENVTRRNNVEIEEGDSGIDANSLGSCSSNEVKVSSTDRQKEKKSKKPTATVASVEPSKPAVPTKRESRSAEKTNETKMNKKKKKKESSKDEKVASHSKENKPSSKATKSKTSPETPTKSSGAKSESKKGAEESNKNVIQSDESKKKKKDAVKLVFEGVQTKSAITERDEFEVMFSEQPSKKKKQALYNHEDSTIIVASSASSSVTSLMNSKNGSSNASKGASNGKQSKRTATAGAVGAGGEEEWKEVVRKCLSPTYRIKKVSVPLTAISRVIGRGGCNINAIRSTTGAHIEIEKQSKGQGERVITIKGSIEATKQAHSLIAALIDDPELDITQVLPKITKPVTTTTSWEKTPTTVKGKVTVATTVTTTTKVVQSIQNSVTCVTAVPGFTKSIVSAPVTTVGVITSTAHSPTVRPSSNTLTRPTAPKISSATFTTFERKPSQVVFTTTIATANSSASTQSVNTKTTMSYTSAIMMSSNKTPMKTPVPSTPIPTTTVVSQTFAAKVSNETTTAKEKEQIIKPPIAPPPPTSTSIFIRPPPTASAPPSLSVTPGKPPFSVQTSTSSMMTSSVTQSIPPLPAQLSQQLSHPPPPLPTTVAAAAAMAAGLKSKLNDIQMANMNSDDPSPVSAASEYSLFNDTFSKVTQQSMWGRDTEESNSQKGMNFASVVTASGATSSSVGSSNTHTKYLDTEPPVQVDAAKAPGYRGTSMCSPNLQKPPPPIRSSAPSIVTSLSPSAGSLSFSSSSNSVVEPLNALPVTVPIARPTSIPSSSMDTSHTFTPRALFHDKSPVMYSREQTNANILKMVQPSSVGGNNSNDSAASLLSQYHSMSYSQPQVTTTVSMSRLNPRAPDFSTTIKPPTVSIPTNQLPPTHQPPPMFNQQSLAAANYISSQHPPTVMAAGNSNIMSYPINKYGQQQNTQQQRADSAQTQWSLINAAAAAAVAAANQHTSYSQNDLMNFAATPTTLNNLIHAQNNDMLAGLENGAGLTNAQMNISPNSNQNLIAVAAAAVGAADVRGEERKMPPKPIGTERAWRTERERTLPMDQDPNSWILDQKLSWNPQFLRNSAPPTVTAVQSAPAPTPAAQYSRIPQMPEEMRPPVLDGVYQNDHYNGIVPNAVMPTTIPPLLPHMNLGQAGSAPILQSYNHDIGHVDSFKIESGWDPSRLCMSDMSLANEKPHHQQSAQPPNWTLSWNH